MNREKHTPQTPPHDTFRADTDASLRDLAQARDVLTKSTPAYETLKKEFDGYVDALRAIFSLFSDSSVSLPNIPAFFVEPVIQQLIDEGVYGDEIIAGTHPRILIRVLTKTSDDEEVRDFHFKVPKPFDFIGIGLTAPLSITIEGNCGSWTGKALEGGTITVKGNCVDNVGDGMTGGTIIIKGNALWRTGSINGGTLIVEGNCGAEVGRDMIDGTFIIGGEVESWATGEDSPFGSDNHGTIIHKEKLIWNNGPTKDTPPH